MMEVGIGHNSEKAEPTPRLAKEQLKSITERINRLEDDKKAITDDIRDVYAEAKSNGYNPKALRIVVRKQREDTQKAAELQADVDMYMAALNMVIG